VVGETVGQLDPTPLLDAATTTAPAPDPHDWEAA